MIIVGIDPGTTSIGYSIIECMEAKISLKQAGLVSIQSQSTENRLKELHLEIKELLTGWKPTALAIERLFFTKNQKTALAVSEARGVILLTTALAHIKVYEYTPLEVKKTITGDGGADKLQVQKIVQLTLPETKNLKARDDVFDAVAIALACYFRERQNLK